MHQDTLYCVLAHIDDYKTFITLSHHFDLNNVFFKRIIKVKKYIYTAKRMKISTTMNNIYYPHNVIHATLHNVPIKKYNLSNALSLTIKDNNLVSLRRFGRFKNLTYLDLCGCPNLVTLDGIHLCPNISTLKLSCPSVETFKPLTSLTKLTVLYIKQNNYIDLDALPQTIQELVVDDCDNITSLPLLPNLIKLRLTDCFNVSNIDSLQHSLNLSTLKIKHCRSIENYDVLQYLTNLHSLSLNKKHMSCDSLKHLTKLRYLNVSNLDSSHGLSSLTNLEVLKLYACKIINFHDMRYLTKLHTLTMIIVHKDLTLDGIEQLHALCKLSIYMGRVTLSIEPLREINLTHLHLKYISVKSLEPICDKKFKKLIVTEE